MEYTSIIAYISSTKSLKSLNWYQMIDMTMFYKHVIRYINNLAILMLNIKENFRY